MVVPHVNKVLVAFYENEQFLCQTHCPIKWVSLWFDCSSSWHAIKWSCSSSQSHYEYSWISILIDSWPTFYNNWLVSSYEDWQAYRSAEAHGSVDTATATSKALVCNSLKCSGIMANLGCIHFLWLGLLPQGHAHACGYCAEGPYSLTNWPMCSSDGVAFVWAKCNMTVGLPLVFLLSSWNDSCIHRVPFLPTSAYYVA
jgi:hypothetical protein